MDDVTMDKAMGIEDARCQFRAWAEDLAELRCRLILLQENLPLTGEETRQDDFDRDPDVRAKMQTITGNSVLKALDSLIQDLRAAAEHPPGAHPGGETAGRLLDLDSGESEERRQLLYELVVKDYFTAHGDLGAPDGIWVPPYSAEQASLEIVYLGGRWFATWNKQEEPPHALPRERWELLVLSENPSQPGTLFYDEV